MKKKFSITIAALFFTFSLFAQRRVARPIQVQLNFSGVLVKSFGNTFSSSEVDHLKVTEWGLPGVSAGYHFKKLLYVGYSFTPARGFELSKEWGFNNEKNGLINVDFTTGNLHNLELRISPFEIGFYGQLFFNYIPKVDYTMDFQRKSDVVTIGENEYETDILANWNFKSVKSLGIGFGYLWVHESGISASIGIALPIIKTPYYRNIDIMPKDQNVEILSSDLELARLTIENESFYFPIQFNLNVGYNFTKNKKETIPVDRF